jgi:phage protein D
VGLFGLTGPAFRSPADCVVRVDEEEISALYPLLSEVTAECSRQAASTARLVFATQRDEHGAWSVQDKRLLAPWKKIVIEVAFGEYTEELFRGYIREVVADYPAEPGDATVTVECQDDSIALDREQVRLAWGVGSPVDDAQIVSDIAQNHGLSLAEGSGTGLANLVLLQNSTDIQFLQARAQANGYELYFRAGEIYFGPMQLDAEPQPAILVYAGSDTSCVSLSVRSDGHRPNKLAIDLAATEGKDITRKEIVPDLTALGSEPADAGGDGLPEFTWLLSREGSFDEDELTARAQQRVNELSMRITAEGELDGTRYGHVLLPGLPVAIDGAGAWLGGVYYVDQVTHQLDTAGYRQQIRLLRNAYGEDAGGGATDRLAGIR